MTGRRFVTLNAIRPQDRYTNMVSYCAYEILQVLNDVFMLAFSLTHT